MATDYISRETVVESLNRLCDRVCQYSKAQRKVMCGACPLGDAFTVIEDDIPAADVLPVARGHYVGEYDGYADGNPVYDMWYCSECGCCFEEWDEEPTYNFCPNCGADMRRTDNG